MNKKTVILLVILVLLTLTVLFRWDLKFYNEGRVRIVTDKISTQAVIMILDGEHEQGYRKKVFGNKYLLHCTTAFLYISIAAVTVALISEGLRKDSEDEKQL